MHDRDAAGGGSDDGQSGRGVNLTARTASGLSWSYLSTASLVVANLIYTATMSRLLDPVAFGLMAMANLVVLFTEFFARMGLASALVQKEKLSDDEVRAASTAGIAVGFLCLAVIWVAAPPIATLFDAPQLPPILRVMGISFLFMGWSMTGLGLLRRELRFKELSVISVGCYLFGYLVVGIGLALLGAGVWSLVFATMASTALQAVWQYVLVRHPMRPVARWEPYREVCGYGIKLSGAHLMNYIGGNLDTLTVARIATTGVLGQYSRAYYLVFQPLGNYMSQALTTVLFSALSRIQSDMQRLRRAYLSVLSLGSVVLFPLCAGIAVASRELVLVVLGDQWDLAVGLVPWFALAGGCHVATQLSQSLAEARAELNRSLLVQSSYLAILASLIGVAFVFRGEGIWVIAAAVATAELLRYLGYLALVKRILGLRVAGLWRAHLPAAGASVGVALAIAATGRLLTPLVPTVVVLAAQITAAGVALLLAIRFLPFPEIRRELHQRLDRAGILGPEGGVRRRLAAVLVGPPPPDDAPDGTPETTPDATRDVTPDVAAEVAAEVAPEVAPDVEERRA